jgi:hypothetical protein
VLIRASVTFVAFCEAVMCRLTNGRFRYGVQCSRGASTIAVGEEENSFITLLVLWSDTVPLGRL